jgi:hypothetical protein
VLTPISSAFQYVNAAVLQPSSRPGPISSANAYARAHDTFTLSGSGLTLEEQTHQAVPKMIHFSHHLEHEHPDQSVKGNLHVRLSLYG